MKLILVAFLLTSTFVQASALVITEIMYDPEGANTGRSWIEIFNDTAGVINVTSWKFFESGSNHSIAPYQGGSSLQSGGYAVIADSPIKFLADYPSYQGIVYDSSFSLPLKGESLSLKETSTSVPTFTVDYTPYVTLGGENDGSTLSFVSSAWVRGRATPGVENIAEEKSLTATSTSNEGQATVAQMTPPSPDIILYIPSEKTVVAGAETEFKVSGMTRSGKQIDDLRFNWAFGDGGRGIGSSTRHTYVYEGRYVAQVEGGNAYIGGTGRTIIRVVPPDIVVTDKGQGKYGAYVDILNPNAYDLDVSGWMISIDGGAYPFPPNTIAAAHSKTRFSGASMGFANLGMGTSTIVKVLFPNLEEIARYVPTTKDITVPQLVQTTSTPMRVAVRTQPKIVLGVSTSTQPQASGSLAQYPRTKDTRLISWLRTFFSK